MTRRLAASAVIWLETVCRRIRLLAGLTTLLPAGVGMAAEITLSNLTQTYDGHPKTVTVTTNPVGLPCTDHLRGSQHSPHQRGQLSGGRNDQ